MYFDREFSAAKQLLQDAKRIVILSHKSPDGDTVGANLALRYALTKQWGKEVISACVDPIAASSLILEDASLYVNDFDIAWPDVIVCVDAGAHYMTNFHKVKPTLFSGKPPVINIDHHPSNDNYGTINIVDANAAAACQIVYHFIKYCGFQITPAIATALLHGMYFDTGSFMHSNVNEEVLGVASQLMWKGADFKSIARAQFHTMPVQQLKLYGTILERAHVNEKGIAVSALTQEDFDTTGAEPDDTTGVIDYLNSIPEGKFCCLVYEDRKGMLKGSLRTRRDDINLSELAGVFGGGGHKKASGFSFPASIVIDGKKVTIED